MLYQTKKGVRPVRQSPIKSSQTHGHPFLDPVPTNPETPIPAGLPQAVALVDQAPTEQLHRAGSRGHEQLVGLGLSGGVGSPDHAAEESLEWGLCPARPLRRDTRQASQTN